MHNPPADGNFCNECGNAMKPSIAEDYSNEHGFCGQGRQNGEQLFHFLSHVEVDKETSFHLLNLTSLKSYVLLSSYDGEKITQGI
jgi:hypothetical protein